MGLVMPSSCLTCRSAPYMLDALNLIRLRAVYALN